MSGNVFSSKSGLSWHISPVPRDGENYVVHKNLPILGLLEVPWDSKYPWLLGRMGPFRNNIPGYIFFIIINNNSAGDIFSFHFLFVFKKICKSSVMNQIHCLYNDFFLPFQWYLQWASRGSVFFLGPEDWVCHLHLQTIFLGFLIEMNVSQYLSSSL